MKFQILNLWTGAVMFECELPDGSKHWSRGEQLGFACEEAVKRGTSLRDANLRGANLRYAVVRGAVLCGADLSGAVLSDADLSGADLRDANLSDAVLTRAVLRDADYSTSLPVMIPNIHAAVYEAASKDGAFDMSTWHNSCGTTHCRAGWVVTLAGEGGKALEWCMGTAAAAALIYMASDPKLENVPDFYCTNEEAMADMKRLAELAK